MRLYTLTYQHFCLILEHFPLRNPGTTVHPPPTSRDSPDLYGSAEEFLHTFLTPTDEREKSRTTPYDRVSDLLRGLKRISRYPEKDPHSASSHGENDQNGSRGLLPRDTVEEERGLVHRIRSPSS